MNKKKVLICPRSVKMIIFMLLDTVIILGTYMMAFLIEKKTMDTNAFIYVIAVIMLHLIVFNSFSGYRMISDNFGLVDTIRFSLLIISVNLISLIANKTIDNIPTLSIWTFLFITAFQIVTIVGVRSTQRIFNFYFNYSKSADQTIIIGAGSAGKIAFDEMHQNSSLNNKVVCFADNDKSKIGKKYLGKVITDLNKIHETIEKFKIKEVVIAISDIQKEKLKEIISLLSKENVKVKRLPILSEIQEPTKPMQIREVSLAELLGREQITFDSEQIEEWLQGKTVLITGGGGSIGSELARQCYKFKVKTLILFDIYENAVYDVQMELTRKIRFDNSDMELITLIGSTYNEFRVEEIFKKYYPDIVFHAAAYKHVPLMEDSPVEAIRTNCLGTWNVSKMADKYGVSKMVLVSTDKAVRPTNTMGATKAFAEMIIRYWSSISKNTSYSAVRFGNVLGSNGSVIPLFKAQIAEGGPVTVTHPDIIRYFMTIPEAVSLILQSGAFATGGEIFILDMGEPVKILTLAENVIKQCGFIPYKDIKIIFTGLRPGEKLFEELLLDTSKNQKTTNKKIFIEEKKNPLPMDENIEFISQVFTMTDNDEIKEVLRKVVTNYSDYKKFNSRIR